MNWTARFPGSFGTARERRPVVVSYDGGLAYLQPTVLAGGRVAVIEVYLPYRQIYRGVWPAWLGLAGLAVVLVAGSTLVADRLGTRLVRATRDLAGGARRLGAGDLTVRVEPAGPPELREAARSFNTMAGNMRQLIDDERELAADLSHRLKVRLWWTSLSSRGMRKLLAYPLVILATAATGLVATAAPASAHGYVSAPPSRQSLCAQRAVPDCGPIQFEPQSVEGPKGLRSCDGGLAQFAVLSDESRNWPAREVGTSVTFTWVFTARHRTADWEYFVGDTRIAVFDGGNQQPEAVVSHQVDLSGFPGRQTVLAIWNIGDTPMAFYNCVDVDVDVDVVVGGGGDGTPPAATPPATTPPVTAPPATPAPAPALPATTAPAPPASGDWVPNQAYQTGDEVTHLGQRYVCRQSHTSLSGWEPSIFTLALWLPA